MLARITNFSAWTPLTAVVLGVLAFTGSPTLATILVPGGGAFSTPGTVTMAGLSLQATETVPFIGTDLFDDQVFGGNLISNVYLDSSTGCLDFTYQIIASGSYPDAIHTVTVDSYTGYSTDVDYVSGSGAVTYATANRLLAGDGDTISLAYLASSGDGIAPGDTSDIVVVKTNATQYDDEGLTNLIDGGGAQVNSFEPVPEPASLGLLAAGGIACALRRSRRRS